MQAIHKLLALALVAGVVSGCAATQTAISKRDLDVQTKMSDSIFLDPVTSDKQVVYVQTRNVSDRPQLDLGPELAAAVQARGYQVTDKLEDAHYLLQMNVLYVGKADPSAAEKAFAGGYGSVIGTAAAGAAAGSAVGGYDAAVAGGLIGGALAVVADAAVKDVTYTIMTDVQVSERTDTAVTEKTEQSLTQGSGGTREVTAEETTNWKRYQTRVMSTANQVNLDFEDALPRLRQGIVRSVSGIF